MPTSINLSDAHLIAIGKLNIYLETVDSGLRSLIRNLLKLDYKIGLAVTAELGIRDLEYILKALIYELYRYSEFEDLMLPVLHKYNELRGFRNKITHATWGGHADPKFSVLYKQSAKGKVIVDSEPLTAKDIEAKVEETDALIMDILEAHYLIEGVW